ncbi:hypothetical protein FQA39_LY08410 [Lamprigera yunnana]|nr:hypothetical protein FQA39_LY08410 [Lamprigera yunnana]
MDDTKRTNLGKQWDKIVKDLHVEHVLDELYSRQILNSNDLEKIKSKGTRVEQTDILLKIIAKKDNQAYDSFTNVLSKDYEWLSKSLQDVNEDSDVRHALEEGAFQDTLVLGNVPRQPPYYVKRTEPLHELQQHLEELQPCQRIVLHGMTGSGKSCLAAAAVKEPDLLHRYFKNRVFWINLGDVKEVDQLPIHMTLMLQILQNDSREANKKFRPISFPSNQDGDYHMEVAVLKNALKNMFLNNYRDALLILDNVGIKEATEAFDVGCKTLITTQVKDIIVGNNSIYMEVKGGFTEKESVTLFAKSLKTEVNKLPLVQAVKIHKLCKGEPILISLIGSLLEPYREDLLNGTNLWQYYIKKLTNKEYNLKTQLFDTISICIKRLTPELCELYYSFSVFVEDVNITPQVMQTIWNLENLYDVNVRMTELQNKSLIVSYYNRELQTFVFGIHDLFLAYLKQKLGYSGIVAQHQKLIAAYKRVSNNNFANLPNDNYIFQYIGYHLKEAQCLEEFSIYFNLKFIGAKIKAIGAADLLRDFQIYKTYITHNNEVLLSQLEEYINFVKAKGHDLYKYSDTDIIQCGLGQDKDSCIFKEALKLAEEKSKSLFLHLQVPPQDGVYFTHTLDFHENVSAACFTSDVNQVLVGMRNGDINLWEQAYNQKLYVFAGHSDSITHLQLCCSRNSFLSVSEDGTAKIWNLEDVVLRNSNGEVFDENGFHKNIPSPRIKQSNWKNFYEHSGKGKIDRSKTCKLEEEYNADRIVSAASAHENNDSIVTGCLSGTVIIWNIEKEPKPVCSIPGRGHRVNCVTFSVDDNLVIFSCDSTIFVYNAENGEFLSYLLNEVNINSLLIVPEKETTIVAINENSITSWSWNQFGLKITNPNMIEIGSKGKTKFLCGAVTDDGMYLVTGSTDYFIRIWHLGTGKIVQEILNNKGLVVCLDTFYDDSKSAVHILLSGSDDKTVKQWHIQPSSPTKDIAKLLPIFDCYWNGRIPRIAVANSVNKVQIMNSYNLIIESERLQSPIKAVRFSLCGNKVAIGLENGDIIEYDYKDRHYETLMNLHDSVVLLKYFNTATNSTYLSPSEFILVAAAHNGWVTIYKNKRALCLVQPPPLLNVNSILKQMPVIPIVQCFYLKSICKLLFVSENRTIKLWDEDTMSCTILYGEKLHLEGVVNDVTMAAFSPDEVYLAITLASGTFEIYSLTVNNSNINLTLMQEKTFNSPLRSCRFSYNGKILALGQDNGTIVIWCVESKTQLGTLQLHKSAVRYLLFSPSPALILISVGDQIAWWDLTKLPDENRQVL